MRPRVSASLNSLCPHLVPFMHQGGQTQPLLRQVPLKRIGLGHALAPAVQLPYAAEGTTFWVHLGRTWS